MLTSHDSKPSNYLLAALSDNEYQRIAPHLEAANLNLRQVLFDKGDAIPYVYFPNESIISLLTLTQEGSSVEVALVGIEGVLGVPAILSSSQSSWQAIVQIGGSSTRMPVSEFQAEFKQGGTLQKVVLRYLQALFVHMGQGVACNRLHRLEERLARWLLTVHDRLQTPELPLTQEFIAQMLGARRSGVTEAAITLQRAGTIRYSRGHVLICDRPKLEKTACECYAIIHTEFQQLISELNVPITRAMNATINVRNRTDTGKR